MSTLTKVILLLNLSLATLQVKNGQSAGNPSTGLFTHTEYDDICDKDIIDDSEKFGIQAIYENLYLKQRTQNLFFPETFEQKYEAHLEQVKQYAQQLEEFQKFAKQLSLKQNGQLYFKTRLRKFIEMIQQKIASSKQLNLQALNPEYAKFLAYFEQRFQMMNSDMSNKDEFMNYLSVESYQYAHSELQQDETEDFYFHEEICALEALMIEAIDYYTKSSTENSQIGDTMDQFDKQLITNFIIEAMEFNYEESGRKSCGLNPFWQELIRNFTNRDQEVDEDKELNRDDLKKLTEIPNDLQEELLDHTFNGDKIVQQSITKRDYLLTYFPHIKENFDLKFLDKIFPKVYQYRYSPNFIHFLLKELPEFINQKNLYPKNITDPNEQKDYLKKINLIFYDLYIQGRHFEIEEQIEIIPYHDVPLVETLKWLKIFLKFLGEDKELYEIFTNEDPQQTNVIIDTEEPLKNKIQIILIIEEFLEKNDDEYDPENRVEEFLRSMNQGIPVLEDPQFNEEIIYNQLNETEEISFVPERLKKKLDVKQKTRSINNVLKTIQDIEIEAVQLDNTPLDDSPMIDIDSPLKNRNEEQNRLVDNGSPQQQREIVNKIQNYLVKVISLVQEQNVIDPKKKDFFIENFLNELEKTMDKMNTNTKLAKFIKAMEPIFSRDIKVIQNYLNLEKKGQVKEMFDIIKEFRKKMIFKLKKRITANLHLGSGLLKVLSWKAKYTTDNNRIDLVGDAMQNMNLPLSEGDQKLVQLDICLLYQNVQQLVEDDLYTHLKEYAERVINNSNYTELCEDIAESYDTTHEFVQDFSRILMGITFMKYFEIFDAFEISQPKDSLDKLNPTHKKLMNESGRKYLVQFYNRFYTQSLYYRLSTRDNYDHPTKFFVLQVERCVQETFNRTQYVQDTECPYEHSHYHEILSFLNYYFGSKSVEPQPQKVMCMNLPTENNMNTTLLNMLLDSANNTYLSAEQICEADQNHQLCEENQIYRMLVDNSAQQNLLAKLLSVEEQKIGDKKYILWNSFVNLVTLHPLNFKQIFADYQNHKKSELVDEVCNLLNVKKSDNWVSEWMKVNFANNQVEFSKLRNTIQNIYSNDQLSEYLLFKETITYNSKPQDVQLVRINQIQPFIYLSGSVANYAQLYGVIQEHAWIILYLKDQPEQTLNDLARFSNKIDNLQMDGDFTDKFNHYWNTKLVQQEQKQLQVVEKKKQLQSDDLFDDETESEEEIGSESEEEVDLMAQNQSQFVANNKSKQKSLDFGDEEYDQVAADLMKDTQNKYITNIQEFEIQQRDDLTPDMLKELLKDKITENAMDFKQKVVRVDVEITKKVI